MSESATASESRAADVSPAPKEQRAADVDAAVHSAHRADGASEYRSVSRRSLMSKSKKAPSGEEGEGEEELESEKTFSAMRRASMVVAARYRSAQRSSSLHRQIGVDGDVRSKHTLSDGEVLAMEKMMENERRHKEVLRRAELINEQCSAVLEGEELEKEQRLMERLHEIAKSREEERHTRAISLRARQEENERRRKQLEQERQAKTQENIRRVNAVRYDPFSYIAMRQRYTSPPPAARSSRRGRSAAPDDGKSPSKPKDRSQSASSSTRPRWH